LLTFTAQGEASGYTLNEPMQNRVSFSLTIGGQEYVVQHTPDSKKPLDKPGTFRGLKRLLKE
jgi:hypothetical protein